VLCPMDYRVRGYPLYPLLEIDLDKSIGPVKSKSPVHMKALTWATFEKLTCIVGPRMIGICNDLRKNFSSNF
jgi:hypothetical protein